MTRGWLAWVGLWGCTPAGPSSPPTAGDGLVLEALMELPIAVEGRLVDASGQPVADVEVTLQDQITLTGPDGTYVFDGLQRHNALLATAAPGWRSARFGVQLAVEAKQQRRVLPTVPLDAHDPAIVRMVFGGDVAFGRRFLDPDEETERDALPTSHPEALIDSANPAAGSIDVISRLEPLFEAADYRVVNLESPVTEAPSTPHLDKDYVFFTLPGSLAALDHLGVDYVSLGNNHLYDYLEAGVSDTLAHLDARGLAHSGAGPDPDAAFAPFLAELGEATYSLVSMSSVSGSQWDVGYVATEDQGGSADLRDEERVLRTLGDQRAAGRVPIALLHTGKEYTAEPSEYAVGRFDLVAEAGAALAVGHHPHTIQGFGLHGDMLAVHSLGNLAFDQDRLETMLGLVAQVDLDGQGVVGASASVVYLEDYRPRPATGELADHALRQVASVSPGVFAYPYADRVHVAELPHGVTTVQRAAGTTVEVGPDGVGIVDLRPLRRAQESVAGVEVSAPGATVRVGRDVLAHGSFEDHDVDDARWELSRWDMGSSSGACSDDVWRGAIALCMARDEHNTADALVAFRNRIRVPGAEGDTPNTELSMFGYASLDNAGETRVVVRYYASEGSAEFGEEVRELTDGGDHPWGPFAWDLDVPDRGSTLTDSARAVRIFLRHEPPHAGDGLVRFDDLAVVAWEEAVPTDGSAIPTPHARDFLRIEAAPGPVTVGLTFEAQLPVAVAPWQ